MADFFDIPIKEKASDTSNGLTIHEVYDTLAHLFEYVFLDTDTVKSYKRRVVASRDTQKLAAVMRKVVESVKAPGIIGRIMSAGANGKAFPEAGKKLVARLQQQNEMPSVEELVWEIIPTQAAAAATQAQAVSLAFLFA